jgi:predicted transcriptional regulator
MNEEDLFTWQPAKLTEIRDTSLLAYDEIKEHGTIGDQERRIIHALAVGRDYSLQEISMITGISINAVSGRCNGLKKKKWLVERDKRRCKVTGRTIRPLSLA